MDTKWLVPLLLVVACSQPISADEKLARLDAERRQELAGLARQQGECNAVSIEFGTASAPHAACMETLRLVADGVRRSISDLDKRIAEIRRIQTKQFCEEQEKRKKASNSAVEFTYLDCAQGGIADFTPVSQ